MSPETTQKHRAFPEEDRVHSWLRHLLTDASDIPGHSGVQEPPVRAGSAAVQRVERVEGGLLNHVWRVWVGSPDAKVSCILKYTPPHVASAPETPLSQRRAWFEQQALLRVADWNPGHGLDIRTPRLLAADPDLGLTLMEDMGPGNASSAVTTLDVRRVGTWLARLHAQAAPNHHNLDVQRSRLEMQYERVGEWLGGAGVAEAGAIGEEARRLGLLWLEAGPCFIHGDLWPPSILIGAGDGAGEAKGVDSAGLAVIDWEFSTMGWPAQDLGHLAAHLMLAGQAEKIEELLEAWGAEAGPSVRAAFHRRHMQIHIRAEVAMRLYGPFRSDNLNTATCRRFDDAFWSLRALDPAP
ncbi:MAG: aminoglycoside phosphotransferase family protein [Rhodothermales bacterium]